ncbi:50S ribosomal protein L29 [Bdellovibrio sp. HCB2-146]|uniref:50S ribosomal protein L29 n=1 Tax=Bdellovibrio sp. HCB2-146 TaxID=3394362 RepID=UPI0039BD4C2A
MKFQEIKDLSVVELKKKRAALSEELFQARIKNSIGQLSNPIEIRNLRRNIAKINTAIVKKVAR